MFRNKKISIFLCVFLIGCMQANTRAVADRPDWLGGGSGEYPNHAYITATGSADDAERAKDRALANLSKVFESRIRETATSTSDVRSSKRDGNESVQSTQRLAQNIQISTDEIIAGARVAEQWYDGTEVTHHALAVLDRKQAGNNMRAEIEKLDSETRYELDRQTASKLAAIARVAKAIDLQTQREALQKSLKVIDARGHGLAAEWNMAQLREQLDDSLSSLRLAASVRKDDLGSLASIATGAMAKAGFPAQSSGYEYILIASFEAQPSFENQGWHWLRGVLNIELTDAAGRVAGQKSWPVKVSSVQAEMLSPRALAEVERVLSTELRNTLLSFAGND